MTQDEHEDARSAADRAERMDALGRLASGLAHDFRNLLWSIDLHAELILGREDAPDAVREDASMIRDAVARGMAVSRQLMDFARAKAPTESVELREAILSVEPLLARLVGKERQIVLDLAEVAGRARIDHGRLEQILINLVMNARDAMPDGGSVTIANTTRTLDAEVAAQLGVEPGDYQVLRVSDTGTGMPAATLERVFEPYFSTKEPGKGTGLGLATTFGVIRAAGGWIRAESEPGAGATFRILIPTARGDAGDAIARA